MSMAHGYAQGHFHCLHAHCSNRTDQEFEQALGLIADEFDDLDFPSPTRQRAETRDTDKYSEDGKISASEVEDRLMSMGWDLEGDGKEKDDTADAKEKTHVEPAFAVAAAFVLLQALLQWLYTNRLSQRRRTLC